MTTIKTFALLSVCLAITACSTPPKPPTVDDSQKRPVNVSEAVNLQICRSELSVAKVVLAEVAHDPRFESSLSKGLVPDDWLGGVPLTTSPHAPVVASTGGAQVAVSSLEGGAHPAQAIAMPNHVFVVRFATGSADFTLGSIQQARLLEQARAARYIVIRGRTDAATESMDESHLAQRRSQAAYNFLIRAVKLPRDAVRVSWQGAGDQAEPGSAATQRQANRRVEIEMYEAKPESEVLVG